jgi:aminotransferase
MDRGIQTRRNRLLSKRSAHLREASILRALTLKVMEHPDGINLGQGVCDLEMPRPLRLGAVESLFRDRATYTPYGGIRPLRDLISHRYQTRYGLRYGVDEIVVTIGSSMAYTATIMTLCDAGDEVVLFEPFYPYHRSAAILAGAHVRTIRLEPPHYAVDFTQLREALSERTRVIVVNTPCNPGGKVWTADEIDQLAKVVEDSNATIVTDEIYEDLVYDGRTHVPPATHPGLFDRTVTISGASKCFSITGWRIGWLAAPSELSRAIGPVFDVMCVCAPRPLQAGVAAALRELPASYYTSLCVDYERRRSLLASALEEGGFRVHLPEGAYYLLADYTARYGAISPPEASFRLLDETHIAAIPADIFFSQNPPAALRFQFAVEEPVILEVARRLGRRSR